MTESKRPNIVLIMADDMGFSDIGAYGAEIRTPNLDGMADQGFSFSQMYNNAKCCPSRASLLTGLYPHQISTVGRRSKIVRHVSDASLMWVQTGQQTRP